MRFRSFSVTLFYAAFFFIDIVFSECIVRLFTVGFADGFPFFMPLFAVGIAFLLGSICGAFGKKWRTFFSFLFAILLLLIFAVQLVYYTFCDSFMSIAQVAMGGDALTHFGGATALAILDSLGGLIWLFLPPLVLLLLTVLGLPRGKKASWKVLLTNVILVLALHFGAVLCLPLGGAEIYSPYDVYHDTFVLGMSTRHFGILTSLRLELRVMLFGSEGNSLLLPGGTQTDDISGERNITEIDFDALIAKEEDDRVRALHEYFSTVPGTKKNEYTGAFEGYNLIFICAESFSQHLIDAERTPTLYKMATEGFRFTDFYNSVCDNTSNGEYAILTGLMPDTSLLGKGWKTFYNYNSLTSSKNNYMPFALGNQYAAMDASAYAIHNHTASYYGRNKTHPNLGYSFIAFGQGLETVETYPTSDVSMMEQTVPLLLTEEDGVIHPFHAYYLTFSGHMPYIFDEKYNDMTVKHKAITDGLPYSNKVKSYIACQQEVEYALAYLIEELDKAGVLDNTLIALTNDHYPYPLGLDLMEEMSGQKMDPEFDKYRSCFLLWSASMEKPVTVDAPACSLDILPTLSNLLGLPYDSRLLMGTDLLSDSEHIAVLADRSFVTDKVMYNCQSGEVTLREGVTELPDGYVESRIALVKNKFTLSTEILYTDYYREIYGK